VEDASNRGTDVVDANSNGKLARAYEVLFGPPYPGLEARVNTFITKFEAVETVRHEENQDKLAQINQKLATRSFWVTVAGVSIAFASLCIGAMALAATIYLSKHSQVDPLKLFSNHFDPVVSSWEKSPEDSSAPMY
jgi:hypothetical protein